LQEDVRQGQRVESFHIETPREGGGWDDRYQGATIGYRKICPVRFAGREFRVRISAARGTPVLKTISAYTG